MEDGSASYGGGLSAPSPETDIALSDCKFAPNVASTSGGGIYQAAGTLKAEGCTFSKNVSSGDGGAITLGSARATLGRAGALTQGKPPRGGGRCLT